MKATTEKDNRWSAVTIILAAVMFAYALHVWAQGQSLWTDEIASTKFAEQPISKLWSDWMRRETNPPLYYTLLAGWTWLAGGSDAALRLLSFLAGAAAIPLGWMVANRAGGARAGAAAALLIALDPAHVFYSQQVRGYALGHTLALGAIVAFITLLARPGRLSRRVALLGAYALSTLGALYVHTTFVLLPAILTAWFVADAWLHHERRALVPEWIAANALVLVGWAWWATITWWQVRHSTNLAWIAPPTPAGAVRAVGEVYVPDGPVMVKRFAQAALAVGFIAGAWTVRRSAALVLPLIALAVPATLYGISLHSPVLLPRTLYWGTGPLLVTVAIGFAALRPRLLGAGLLLVLLGAMVADTLTHRTRATPQPWSAAVAAIRSEDPAARVIAIGPPIAYALERYCRPPDCRFDLHTVPLVGETYMADMARPGPVAMAELGELARPRVYTVRTVGRNLGPGVVRARGGQRTDPAPWLTPVARPERLAVDGASDGGIEVIRWTSK